jgi:hypothetical protein
VGDGGRCGGGACVLAMLQVVYGVAEERSKQERSSGRDGSVSTNCLLY